MPRKTCADTEQERANTAETVRFYLSRRGQLFSHNQNAEDQEDFVEALAMALKSGKKLIEDEQGSFQDPVYYNNLQKKHSELSMLRSVDSDETPVCRIVNVVASFNLNGMKLDPKKLLQQRCDIPCLGKKRGMKALDFRIAAPPYLDPLKIFLFLTGKVVIEGAFHEEHALQGAIQLTHYLTEKLMPCSMSNWRIHNIVAVGSLGFEIDLHALTRSRGMHFVQQKHNFPAVVIRPPSPHPSSGNKDEKRKIVVLIFSTGMFVWTGVKKKNIILEYMKPLVEYLKQFKLSTADKNKLNASEYTTMSTSHSNASAIVQKVGQIDAMVAAPVQAGLKNCTNTNYYQAIDLKKFESDQNAADFARLGQRMILPLESKVEAFNGSNNGNFLSSGSSNMSLFSNNFLTFSQCIDKETATLPMLTMARNEALQANESTKLLGGNSL